jgi:hypothetical protein
MSNYWIKNQKNRRNGAINQLRINAVELRENGLGYAADQLAKVALDLEQHKTQFERLAASCPIPCDICGNWMHAMYGGGYDIDRICCSDPDCCAEIEFPTSTFYQQK